MLIDRIYLDKRNDSNITSDWLYYRITSIDAPDVPAGKEGATVQVSRLAWPTLTDIESPTDSPGQTAFTSVYVNVVKILKERWAVEHRDENLIGVRSREGRF